MISPWQKKAASFRRAVFWIRFGSSLAGPFRQQAGAIEEPKMEETKEENEKEPAHHGRIEPQPYFGHNTIWLHRRSGSLVSVPSSVTSASQTWVVRPRWTGLARHAIAPSRAVARKFAFSSRVVKPLAPCGRWATQP